MTSQPASAWSKPVLRASSLKIFSEKAFVGETTGTHSFMHLAIVVFTFKYLYVDDIKDDILHYHLYVIIT